MDYTFDSKDLFASFEGIRGMLVLKYLIKRYYSFVPLSDCENRDFTDGQRSVVADILERMNKTSPSQFKAILSEIGLY